jgi:hypothetical protein
MNGGKISGNSAQNGGGVRVEYGNLVMSGGYITGNSAYHNNLIASSAGGGIYGGVTMTGGVINNNTCTVINSSFAFNYARARGGAVFIPTNAAFEMSGGSISGNTVTASGFDSSAYGGGVFIDYSGTLSKYPVGGIIYGSETAGMDGEGHDLKNTARDDGQAVYYYYNVDGKTCSRARNNTLGEYIGLTTGSDENWND